MRAERLGRLDRKARTGGAAHAGTAAACLQWCGRTLSLKLLEADVVVLDLQLLDEKHGRAHVVEQDDRLTASVQHQHSVQVLGRLKKVMRNLYKFLFLTIQAMWWGVPQRHRQQSQGACKEAVHERGGVGMLSVRLMMTQIQTV